MTVETWEIDETTGRTKATLKWADAPDASFDFELSTGGRVLSFTARSPDGISARGLRQVPIGAMQRALRRDISLILRGEPEPVGAPGRFVIRKGERVVPYHPIFERDEWRHLARDFEDRPRPGAAGRADEHYAALAAMYVDLLATSSRPTQDLADLLGEKVSAIRNYIYKARERGLLTTAGRGKAGGELTDKARRLLAHNEED